MSFRDCDMNCFLISFYFVLVLLYIQWHLNIAFAGCLPDNPFFLLVFTARCYASAVLAMGLWMCLSVSVYVTSRSSTKTAKRRITQTTPRDSPGTNFLMPKISAKFDRGRPLCECRWGGSKWVPSNHPIFCNLHRHSQLRNGWTWRLQIWYTDLP